MASKNSVCADVDSNGACAQGAKASVMTRMQIKVTIKDLTNNLRDCIFIADFLL
jgi:hypothetical protein